MTERGTVPPPGEIEAHLYDGDVEAFLAWLPECIVAWLFIPADGQWKITSMHKDGPFTEYLDVGQYLALDHEGAARVLDADDFEALFFEAGEN